MAVLSSNKTFTSTLYPHFYSYVSHLLYSPAIYSPRISKTHKDYQYDPNFIHQLSLDFLF